VTARTRHQGRQSGEEVERLEQELAGAVAKGPLESVHHQAVTVTAQALECERGSSDIATQALELLALVGPAGDRRIQREPVAGRGECLGRLRQVSAQTWGLRLAARLPDAQRVELEDAGHMVPVERPARFAEALIGFAARI
jgi:hypothetical protein